MTLAPDNHPTPQPAGVLVRKTLVVEASQERAFDVFTRRMTEWWPLDTHTIGKVRTTEAVIEPVVGGRWFGRCVDGSECSWGRVLAWEPPSRVVLGWEITADWQHDAALKTEVEVRFTKEGRSTRVDLEHRLLERYGDRAEMMRGIFDSEEGWTSLLAKYGARIAGGETS
jgi:uncharacterized protein YndB with AHSA1/START domain